MRSLSSRKSFRRDPAPSRWSYRFQRLWLTPTFRQVVRVGMPSLLVLAGLVAYLSDADRQRAIGDAFADMRRSVEERPEFMVKVMSVGGASDALAQDVRDVLAVDLPLSSFDLDLESMRKEVESLDAVERAEVRVRSGGILQIRLQERVPAIIWRGADGLELLDLGGHRVDVLERRADRADLPVIAGEGASEVVQQALELLERAGPIRSKIRGLVRVSETRWDLVLDSGQRIMLPSDRPGPALDRVLAWNEAQDLFARDVTHIDIRNAQRPTLRMSANAVQSLKELQGIVVKKDVAE